MFPLYLRASYTSPYSTHTHTPAQEVLFPLNTYFLVKAKLSENPKKFLAQQFGNRDMTKIDIYDLVEVTETAAMEAWAKESARPTLNAAFLRGLIGQGKQPEALELPAKEPCDLTVADEATGGTALTAAIDKALPHPRGEIERERERGATPKQLSPLSAILAISACYQSQSSVQYPRKPRRKCWSIS